MKKWGVILIFGLTTFISSTVLKAQGCGWDPVTPGPFNTWTAPLCGREGLTIQPLFFYNNIRGIFNDKREYVPLEDNIKKAQLNSQIFFQYGIFEHLEIDLQLNFINNYLKSRNKNTKVSGIGDTILTGRYCPFEEKPLLPHITGLIQVKFPTGKYKNGDRDKMGLDLLGTGSTDFTFGVNLSKKMKPFIFHNDLLFTIPASRNIDGRKIEYGKSINFNLAGEIILPHRLSLMFEFNALSQRNRKENNLEIKNSSIESGLTVFGIGYSVEKVQFLLGYQKTIYGKNTDYIEGIAFTIVCSIF